MKWIESISALTEKEQIEMPNGAEAVGKIFFVKTNSKTPKEFICNGIDSDGYPFLKDLDWYEQIILAQNISRERGVKYKLPAPQQVYDELLKKGGYVEHILQQNFGFYTRILFEDRGWISGETRVIKNDFVVPDPVLIVEDKSETTIIFYGGAQSYELSRKTLDALRKCHLLKGNNRRFRNSSLCNLGDANYNNTVALQVEWCEATKKFYFQDSTPQWNGSITALVRTDEKYNPNDFKIDKKAMKDFRKITFSLPQESTRTSQGSLEDFVK